MKPELVEQEKRHLADMLEAVQRCVYFLDAASASLEWPLKLEALVQDKKNTVLFNTLATINERFAKLQDTLGAAMRHSMGLLSEPAESNLPVWILSMSSPLSPPDRRNSRRLTNADFPAP